MIRVVIADDHPVVRRGLRETLMSEPDIAVLAEVARAEDVVPMLTSVNADVLLLDLSMPGRGGMDVIRDVRRVFPFLRVLVVSMHTEPQYAVRAVRAGAAGYLTKATATEELIEAVRSVAQAGRYISESVGAALADFAEQAAGQASAHDQLSNRELEVVRLLVGGRTISEIANELTLSVKTISTYRSRAVEKLRLRTTADLVRYALEHDLFR
jgi:DNA-binding NarL/FixJ family response regulator